MASAAKLYALKISSGTSGSATTSASVAAWDWCVTHKNDSPAHPIVAISYSFGGGYYTGPCNNKTASMTAAAENANMAGITVLASSGNEGYCDGMAFAACISPVISVGAVYDANIGDRTWCLSSNSCIGYSCGCTTTAWCGDDDTTAADQVTAYSNPASFLDILAPSNDAYTTDIVGEFGYDPGNYAPTFGGTSAACPYAAGAVAALQSAAKELTGSFLSPDEVRSTLVSTGDLVTDGKVNITKPRVNLGNAIDAISCSGQYLKIHNDGSVPATIDSMPGVPGWATLNPPPPYVVPANGSVSVCVIHRCNSCSGENRDASVTVGSDSITFTLDCEEWGACCQSGTREEGISLGKVTGELSDAALACDFVSVLECRANGGAWWGHSTRCADFTCPDCETAFVHVATIYDTSFNYTMIDHPATNGNPDAIVMASQVYNPGGQSRRYNNVPVGVWYSTNANKWSVFNEDGSTMPVGAAFNIEVLPPSDMAFTHVASAANVVGNRTILDHPLTNGNRDAIVMATQNWTAGASTYNPSPIGVYYTGGTWRIFNEDRAAMPVGAGFNVVVLPPDFPSAFTHQASVGNIAGATTVITNPLTTDNPGAVLEITQNWTAGGGTYNPRPVGAFFTPSRRWGIFNEDLTVMVDGAAFNVKVASNCDSHDAPEPCCFMDAECLELPPNICSLFGGIVQASSTCDDTSCSILGACCELGACVGEYKTESACTQTNRTWHALETCSTVTCPPPPPTGACCLSQLRRGGGGCVVVSAAECTDLGGSYLGDDVSCVDDPCEPFGACCAGITCDVGFVCDGSQPQWCDGSFDCLCANARAGGTACLKFVQNCGPPCNSGACPSGATCVDLCFCNGPACMQDCPSTTRAASDPLSNPVDDTGTNPLGDSLAEGSRAAACNEMRQDDCELQGGVFHGDQSLCADIQCQECEVDIDCDDGKYCNGAETCRRGTCRPGQPPDCGDGIPCTQDGCDEANDRCVNIPRHGRCDDGLYCNGSEGCHATRGCLSGQPPNCGDGLACTLDVCDEQNDTCTHSPRDSRCSNGQFCDGSETCDLELGCQPGTPPDCADGVGCTQDECSEQGNICVHIPRDGRCDNGQFCDGEENCHAMLGCQPGERPDCDDGVDCTVDGCFEGGDFCAHDPRDGRCDNGVFCDGAESCHRTQGCRVGSLPDCSDGEVCTEDTCDEALDECTQTSLPDCDDDTVCDIDDNCPTFPNADQANVDGDAHGDACDGWFDSDRDGDVDYDDLENFTECLSQPSESASSQCLDVNDVNGDGQVDLWDAAALMLSWSGVVTVPCDQP